MDFITSLANTVKADQVVCDPVAQMADFDPTRYMGTWYEQIHVKDSQEPTYYQCSTAQYTDLDTSTSSFNVYNSFQTPILGHFLPRFGVHAKATCESNYCYISFFGKEVPTPNLLVADTDYDNYSISYRCDTEGNKIYLWINTREPSVSDEYFQSLQQKAIAMFPNFDTTWWDPQLTQGDQCSYASL